MSSDDDFTGDPTSGVQPMVLYRVEEKNRAIMLGRGMTVSEHTNSKTGLPFLSISMGTMGKYSDSFNVEADPEKITPLHTDMSLFDKIMLRFNAAAKNGTNVDLRFCSGTEATRNPDHDNLRPGYGGLKIG